MAPTPFWREHLDAVLIVTLGEILIFRAGYGLCYFNTVFVISACGNMGFSRPE